MSATDTRIPVSKAVRRELQIMKAERDARSYDEVLRSMIDTDDAE